VSVYSCSKKRRGMRAQVVGRDRRCRRQRKEAVMGDGIFSRVRVKVGTFRETATREKNGSSLSLLLFQGSEKRLSNDSTATLRQSSTSRPSFPPTSRLPASTLQSPDLTTPQTPPLVPLLDLLHVSATLHPRILTLRAPRRALTEIFTLLILHCIPRLLPRTSVNHITNILFRVVSRHLDQRVHISPLLSLLILRLLHLEQLFQLLLQLARRVLYRS